MSESQTDKLAKLTEEGVAAYERRDYATAINTLLRVTDKQPQNWVAKFYLAQSYWKSGEVFLAINHLRFLAKNCPDEEIRKRVESTLAIISPQSPKVTPQVAKLFPPALSKSAEGHSPSIDAAMKAKALVNTATGKRYSLSESKMTIGRGPSNQIVFSDDTFMSQVQSIITQEADDFWIEDSVVINPTKVNGKPIISKAKLNRGDTIRVGKTTLRVE